MPGNRQSLMPSRLSTQWRQSGQEVLALRATVTVALTVRQPDQCRPLILRRSSLRRISPKPLRVTSHPPFLRLPPARSPLVRRCMVGRTRSRSRHPWRRGPRLPLLRLLTAARLSNLRSLQRWAHLRRIALQIAIAQYRQRLAPARARALRPRQVGRMAPRRPGRLRAAPRRVRPWRGKPACDLPPQVGHH